MANQIASLENRMREQGAFVPVKKSAPFKVEITRIGSDSKYAKQVLSDEDEINEDGGPGSGNWGHAGVKGRRGGSAPGGGKSNRISLEGGGFSSAAKQRAAEKAAAKAAAGSGHTIVNGKDISLSYNGSPDINDVLKAQGFNGKPRLVQQVEFDAAVKASSFIAQRTYSADSQEVLDAYRDQLYNGEFYVDCSTGGSMYGKGMYCAADYNGELTEGIRNEMMHYTMQYAHLGRELSEQEWIANASEALKNSGHMSDEAVQWAEAFFEKNHDKSKPLMSVLSEEERDSINAVLHDVSRRAEQPHYTETLTLDPSAKVITFRELQDLRTGNIDYAQYKKDTVNRLLSNSGLSDAQKTFVAYNLNTGVSWKAVDKAANELGHDGREAMMSVVEEYGKTVSKQYNQELAIRQERAKVLQDKYSDVGAMAAALGYDAINAEGHGQSGSYTVVLNRTKLIILDGRGHHDGADDSVIHFQYDTDGELYAIRNGEVIGQIFTTDGSAAQREDESLRKKADSSVCAPVQILIRRRPYFRSELADRFRSLMAMNSLDIAGLGGTISSDPPNLDGGKGSGPPIGNQNAAGPHKGAGQSKGRFVSYKERRKIEARLKGQVSSQGTTVNHVSGHAFDRVGGRMISVGRIEKMLQSNNVSQDKDYANRKVYDIPGSRMVLSDDGTIVTVMWRKKNK